MVVALTSITPASENNVGLVEVNIIGTGFLVPGDLAINAQLVGVSTINAVNFEVVSDILIRCDFNVYGATAGQYNVVVTGMITTDTIINGFDVTLSNNYCTFTDVKRFCLINRVNPNYNGKINDLIPRASELIELETKRVFNVRTFTETLDDNGKQIVEDCIFTEYFPIQSVTSLTIDGTLKVLNTDYWVYRTYILYNDTIVSDPQGVVVNYTGGYVELPQNIHQVCIEIASIMANLKTVTYTTDEGIDKSVILTSFPDYIEDVFKKYRKVEIW